MDSTAFDRFLTLAWDEHASTPEAVAGRLGTGVAMVDSGPQLVRIAHLVHHLYGDHLNDRSGGIAWIDALTRLPDYQAGGESEAALRRFAASLRLSDDAQTATDAFGPSDRIRVLALAVSNLVDEDLPRAEALFHQALALVEQHPLRPDDPMHGDLALTAHNMASALDRRRELSDDMLALMLLAAQTARRHWRLAGDPSDVFFGEYRLALTWRRHRNFELARAHAQACADLATAQGDPAQERFLAAQALALIEHAAGETDAAQAAAARAHAAYAELDVAEQARQAARHRQLAPIPGGGS